MLWEITGTPHRILGSFHLLPEKAVLPDWVTASYQGIGRFVFESDYRDESHKNIGLDTSGAHLNIPGAAEAYSRASALMISLGYANPFDGFRPWRAAFYVINCLITSAGIFSVKGVDSLLWARADSEHLLVDFLESPGRSLELLDLSCENAECGLPFFEEAISQAQSGAALTEFNNILQAWFAGDLWELTLVYSDALAKFPFIYEPLIRQRNREWALVAQRMISEKTPTLFVVGALHTVGPGSFLEELNVRDIQTRNISGVGI